MMRKRIQKLLNLIKSHPQGISTGMLQKKMSLADKELGALITELTLCGYPLEFREKLYYPGPGTDLLLPFEFPGYEDRVHYRQEVSSTMEWARELAAAGSPDGTILIADTQNQGKGRMSRVWDSPAGGLYFTLLLRPKISPSLAYLYNFAAAIALAQTFIHKNHLPAAIKWPNDILISQKKISGILLELNATTSNIHYLNIGIGVNVNNTLPADLPQATSLLELSGEIYPRKKILLGFLQNFEILRENLHPAAIIEKFKEMSSTIGRQVSISLKDGKRITGLARDLDQEGALEILDTNGTIQKIHFGDCVHL